MIKEFENMTATVMGLGSFGGGEGAAKFLAENGAVVTVTDLKTEKELAKSIDHLSGYKIRYVLGEHRMRDFTSAHIVIVNPAVPRESPFITAARRAGAMLRTEIGLFLERCPAKVCGVTGSNGKTTTVSMIGSILGETDIHHFVGGNIGGSLLSILEEINNDTIVILELSSFQLEWLNEMSWSPDIAVVLNVMPNHLDRHLTMENYIRAKGYILDHQRSSGRAILVRDNPISRALADRARCRVTWVGIDMDVPGIILSEGRICDRSWRKTLPVMETAKLKVPGRHNILNAMVATGVARELKINCSSIVKGLEIFRGIPNRLELIGEVNEVRFFNDSKATTPEAAVAGVTAFDSDVIPILGGYDKGVAFDEMAKNLKGKISWAAVIGDTAQKIEFALKNEGIDCTVFPCMKRAFDACASRARAGQVVLLSPGCASYDMYDSYEHRGDVFRSIVRDYIQKQLSSAGFS